MALEMFQRAILTVDMPADSLRSGDVGTIVDEHNVPGIPEIGYSVEFFDMTGHTVAVVTVPASSFARADASGSAQCARDDKCVGLINGTMSRPHGVAAIAVTPGFMRTERIMAAHAVHPFELSWTESPEYLARAIRALAEDADVMRHTGEVLTVGDLAREYGFTDVDGRQPAAFRFPPK